MSSVATFYLLPETKRAEFIEAQRHQKTVRYQRGWFGTKEIVTGERFLWEYLDSASSHRSELEYSGFALIDYLFTFLAASLPSDLAAALGGAAVDDHHHAIDSGLAARLAAYLQSNPPDLTALKAFVAENNPDADEGYVETLREVHAFLTRWLGDIAPGSFGVIHVTF